MEADKRFAHITNDPKFRRIPKGQRKVKIDKRFQSMFKDKKFKVRYTVDKRGRPVTHSTTEDLKRYYDLESDESEENDEKVDQNTDNKSVDSTAVEGDYESSGEDDESDIEKLKSKQAVSKAKKKNLQKKGVQKTDLVSDQIKNKLKNLNVDYARGEGNLVSGESSSDDTETDEDVQEADDAEGIDHRWGELDADAEHTEEATKRLAACNMDWDRIRATDLIVLFNSFLPPGGSIFSVVIYPSEFGKKRLAEEEVKGPAELVDAETDENDRENEEGAKYHMEKLRKYQLNRLKYYYAVVTCDSASSANKIYSECDGMEYESSATKIDLRFIPDDMEFDDAPKEMCETLPELTKYKPRFFTTTALQQAKVDLTWDETNPDRVEIAEKLASGKIDEIADGDLQAYLASSSGEESENEEHISNNENSHEDYVEVKFKESKKSMIDKYKMLIQEIENKEKSKEDKDIGMEISWGLDLQKKTEELLKEKQQTLESKTPFKQYLEKRKEKRKEKREARKRKKEEEGDDDFDVPSDIDMNDSYFAEEFNKPEFKSAKNGKKSASSKRINSEYTSESESEQAERKAQLELLLNDDDDNKKHFSLKKIQDNENESKSKKKRKGKQNMAESAAQDDFQVDVSDERFSALFTSHHFNIDPTDPHFKKTKNMDKLISEKIKRRIAHEKDANTDSLHLKKKKLNKDTKMCNAELNVLVKSVKRKAEAFKNKNQKK